MGNLSNIQKIIDSMDRGAWWATVHGVAESGMTELLSTYPHI